MAAGAIAAGGLSAIGSLYAGQATASSLNAQAKLQQQNAAEAEQQGAYDAAKSSMIAGTKIGAIQANIGASGVTSQSMSAIEILRSSSANAELDRLNILHGADVKAINYQNQASLDQISANSALTGSYLQAAGALVGGGANAYKIGSSGASTFAGD